MATPGGTHNCISSKVSLSCPTVVLLLAQITLQQTCTAVYIHNSAQLRSINHLFIGADTDHDVIIDERANLADL